MRADPKEVVWAGLARATTNGVNLLLYGLSTAGALLMHSWVVFGAASAAYVTIIGAQLARGRFWRAVVKEVRQRAAAVPGDMELADDVARRFAARIVSARLERASALECAPGEPSPATLELLATVSDLEEHTVTLIFALDRLGRYLGRQNPAWIRAEGERTRRALAESGANDAEHGWVAAVIGQRAHALDDLAAARAALVARLEAAVQTLELLPCRLAQLRIGESVDAAGPADETLRQQLVAELVALLPAIEGGVAPGAHHS